VVVYVRAEGGLTRFGQVRLNPNSRIELVLKGLLEALDGWRTILQVIVDKRCALI